MRASPCLVLSVFTLASVLGAPSSKGSANRLPVASHILPIRHSSPKQVLTSLSPRQDDEIGPPAVGVGFTTNIARGVAYITDVEVGGFNYSLIVDTGSSDTWLAKEDFVCLDVLTRNEAPIEQCRLGPLFEGSLPGGEIDDLQFNVTYGYAGGPTMAGSYGYADFTVGGIHVPDLQIALADRGSWPGDDVTTGILGLGLKALTETANKDGDIVTYDPLVSEMQNHGIPAVFSVALSRNDDESYLAFGGIPDVETGEFVSLPIVKHDLGLYARYNIQPDRIVVNNSRIRGTSNNPPLLLVDSGTTLTLLPLQHAEVINSLFDPPAVFLPELFSWWVECDATPPTLGIEFGDKMFYNDPEYMILPDLVEERTGWCASGIGVAPESVFVLGQAFMQGHVVVFDIDEEVMEIRIADRL